MAEKGWGETKAVVGEKGRHAAMRGKTEGTEEKTQDSEKYQPNAHRTGKVRV